MYSNSALLLFDDIFSALDTKTALTLWNRTFCSDLLKNRTIILVTQLAWVANEADLAITMDDGSVKSIDQNLGHVRTPKIVEARSDDEDEPAGEGNGKKANGAVTPTTPEEEGLTDVDNEVATSGVLGGFSCESIPCPMCANHKH